MAYELMGFIPVGIAFVMSYIGFNMDAEHKPLKLFFILLSLWLLVLAFANNLELINCLPSCASSTDITNNLEIGYKGMMWLAVFGSIYFALMLLFNVLLWLIDLVKSKRL